MIEPTLFVVAAGSGGHIVPALQIAEQWSEQVAQDKVFAKHNVIFFTGSSELEKKILKTQPAITQVINWSLRKFSLRQWWAIPLICAQFIMLFGKSFFYLHKYRPEKVISTGGLLSLPLCLAACFMRYQVEIYELNVIPGKAVKALLPFVNTVHIVFPQTRAYCRWGWINFSSKCRDAVYPVRFNDQDKHVQKSIVIDYINSVLVLRNVTNMFDASRKTLFILGGSQGSRMLNSLVKDFIQNNGQFISNLQIIHQVGSFEERLWEEWYEQVGIPALTFGYDDAIGKYYALADVIVCRAGAGTLFEIAFFGKRCIVIPLVAATTNHQVYNAYAMAQQYPGLFTVLEQKKVVEDSRVFCDEIERRTHES